MKTLRIALQVAAAALIVGTTYAIVCAPTARAPRNATMHRLRRVAGACGRYAKDNAGALPQDWSQLGPYVGNNLDVFLSAWSNHPAGAISNVLTWTDFVYVRGLTTSAPPRSVLAYLPAGHSKHPGVATVSVDTTVRWLTVREFTTMMNTPQPALGGDG